jgi:iron complex transport system substrate-binding protein
MNVLLRVLMLFQNSKINLPEISSPRHTGYVKIASLSPAATEILCALGAKSSIVCTDQFSNFPEEVKNIPHLRDHQTIRPQDIAAYEPDVILTATVIQEKLAAELKSRKLPVLHQDIRTYEQVLDSIRAIGVLVEREDAANALIANMKREWDLLKSRAKLLPRKAKVYVEEWHQPPMVSGNWVPELIRSAGAIPFPIDDGELSHEVSLDDVRTFDPDLIVISWCGAGLLADKKILIERAGWQELRAVKEGNVRVIDDSLLNRPGPRLINGAQNIYGWLFELLH